MNNQPPNDYYPQNSQDYSQYGREPAPPQYAPPPPGSNQPGMYPPVNPYPAYPAYPYPVPEQGRGMALTGFILGIISFFAAFVPFIGLIIPILGIVFSALGRRSVSRRTLATLGLVFSIIGLVLSFVMLFVYYAIGSANNP